MVSEIQKDNKSCDPEKKPPSIFPPDTKFPNAKPQEPLRVSMDKYCWINRELFMYCWPLVMYGWRNTIDASSALEIPSCFRVTRCAPSVEQAWKDQRELEAAGKIKKASLAKVLTYATRWAIARGVTVAALNGLINAFVRPYILRECIYWLQDSSSQNMNTAIILWSTLLLASVVEGWSSAAVLKLCCDDTFTMFSATLCRLTCSKCFTVASSDTKSTPASLIGNDLMRTYEQARAMGYLPLGLAAVIGGVVMLFLTVGLACLGGIVTMAVILVITRRIAGMMAKQQGLALQASQERLALLDQVVDSSKAVKFFSWEEPYLALINKKRDSEVAILQRLRWYLVVSVQLGRASPVLSAAATIICMVLSGMELRTADIFATISVFMALRLALIILPQGWMSLKLVLVAVNRFQDFLELPDEPLRMTLPENSKNAVEIVDARLSWKAGSSEADPDVVVAGSAVVPQGKLVAVVGPVGVGKTTLISAVVGDLCPFSGTARAAASLAYAPQQPQVICGTISENILMGRPHDAIKLQKAIESAQLVHDLQILAGGLEAEIGERGVSLSGGQKQRISLARTMYGIPENALLVLDDPIAAVDALVGKRLMESVVLRHRSRGGSALIAINQQEYFHLFDSILVLQDGVIREEAPPPPPATQADPSAPAGQSSSGQNGTTEATNNGNERSDLILQEVASKGPMGSQVVFVFLRSAGLPFLSAFTFTTLLGYGVMASADLWLVRWTQLQDLSQLEHLANLGIYIAQVLCFMVSVMASSRIAVLATTRACKTLHLECLSRLMNAPLSWWESTPKGRITARFSTDMGIVDQMLGFMCDNVAQLAANLLALCFVVALVIPPLTVLIVLCFACFCFLFVVIDKTNREIKRMAQQAVSPILSNISECTQMKRVSCILGVQAFFGQRNDTHVDKWNQMNFGSNMLMHFSRFLAAAISSLVTAGACAWLMFGSPDEAMLERSSIALTYAISIPYFLGMGAQVVVMVKSQFTAVERLLEYRVLPQEPQWHLAADPAEEKWPTAGAVEFRAVELRYRPHLPPALKGVTFALPGGARVGVIGRTGSGKSTLLAALFRLHEISAGEVLLDGMNISALGLRCLRRRLTVVPQDPVLMQGTVRQNLDPFGSYDVAVLRRSLRRAEMATGSDDDVDAVLDRTLEGGGANLSCGERQLLCLARAVISGPKVLVMDEPTSSADSETDKKLQSMVRSEFKCTTLCIAHRLQTVVDSDLMLVMADGKVEEFGAPKDLFQQEEGHFRTMCDLANVRPEAITALPEKMPAERYPPPEQREGQGPTEGEERVLSKKASL